MKAAYQSTYIRWIKKYETGISIIDEQHRGIVSLINTLFYFIQTGKVDSVIDGICVQINAMSAIHFQTEEAMLELAAYPLIKDHASMHRSLMIELLRVMYEAKSTGDYRVLLRFLKDWWLSHITIEDAKYTSCVHGELLRGH